MSDRSYERQEQHRQEQQPQAALAKALAHAVTEGSTLRQLFSEQINWEGKYSQGQIHVQSPVYDERSARFKVRIEPNEQFEVTVQRASSSM